jgi:hypothetical protein
MPSKIVLNITDSLNICQMEEEEDAITFKNSFPLKFPGFKIIPIIKTEIKFITHSLTSDNKSDYDKIASKI